MSVDIRGLRNTTRLQPLAFCALLALLCGCGTVGGGRSYAERQAQEQRYLRFAQHKPYVPQPFPHDRYLETLEQLTCEKFNFEHRYLREMVTESENHRLGIGFCNDVAYFSQTEQLTLETAAQKVRQMIMKDDEKRPSVYENEKRWPRIQAWHDSYNAKAEMDARPKITDLSYYRYLRRIKGIGVAEATQTKSSWYDEDYQKYQRARYPKDKSLWWKVDLADYRDALTLLRSDAQPHRSRVGRRGGSFGMTQLDVVGRPVVSRGELQSCLNMLQNGLLEEISEKQRRDPKFQIDQEWYAAIKAKCGRIESILREVETCEKYVKEQNRRIELARDYNKATLF